MCPRKAIIGPPLIAAAAASGGAGFALIGEGSYIFGASTVVLSADAGLGATRGTFTGNFRSPLAEGGNYLTGTGQNGMGYGDYAVIGGNVANLGYGGVRIGQNYFAARAAQQSAANEQRVFNNFMLDSEAGYSGPLTTADLRVRFSLTAREVRGWPGVATASQPALNASGLWLDAATPAPIPGQVVEALAGRQFNSMGDLRSAVWREVAANPELNSGFTRSNLIQMTRGNAPFVPNAFQTGNSPAQMRFNLHHQTEVGNGGQLYDLSNIRIVSPRVHQEIHYGQ